MEDLQRQLTILAMVALAMLLGAILGIERESAGKPAGLRTHMLVAGAAALLTAIGEVVVSGFSAPDPIRADPLRIIEAVITGVSVLGAGTIIRRGDEIVEGLTTAAALLLAASVGVCVAVHQVALAVGITILVLVTLRALMWVELRVAPKRDSA